MGARLFGVLTTVLLIAGVGATAQSAVAAPTPMVDLGQASTYAVFSGASVGNTVSAPGAPHTTVRGDLGVKANTEPTGFPPGVVTGAIRFGTPAAALAHDDLVAAYGEIASRTGGAPLAGALAGVTVGPGLHTIAAAASNTTTVTLDAGGDPNAVFVFQVNGALAFAAGSHVVLKGGAQASRVFWQVNGAGAIGANADFAGTLIALDAVSVGNGSLVNGRTFARNGALTLDANEFYSAAPLVTIDGGAAAMTTDTTPTISGTTDVESPAFVTVTINGQTLTTMPSGGVWSVTSAILANGTYPVEASVRDAAGNLGSADQDLTVDTVLPVITIDDGPAATTNDSTPTISGTSDAAPGTVVRVFIDSQVLTALVQTTGTWNIRAAAVADGTRTVTAAISDPAGNEGTDSQELTVDTASPAVTIDGGASALTNDATPTISGTADVAPGTTVTVNLADETLTAPVQGDKSWAVTAAALSDGPHRVVASVSDAAGNPASYTQTLTVDTDSPHVGINGGSAATTSDNDPTIVGTSDAAPGTTITVSISGQTMTTLLQPGGTWNVTPTYVGPGTWSVVASAPDPAGNVGRANQSLTITQPTQAGTGDSTGTGGGTTETPTETVQPETTPPTAPIPATVTPPPAASVAAQTTVARSTRQRVRRYPLVIGTRVSAPATGRIRTTATGLVRIKGVRRAIRLTTTSTTILAGRTATLKLRLRGTRTATTRAFGAIKRAVTRRTAVTASITVTITDEAGTRRSVRRTVKLTK